jgi:hypothetical protein
MKKIIIYSTLLLSLSLAFTSCKKEEEVPPIKSMGPVVTIADLKAIASCTNNCERLFKTDTYFSGVVLADNVTGNFYKETYIRDFTGAIHITLKSAVNLFVGDSIRVNLKGLSVGYNPTTLMLEIDSVETDKSFLNLGKGVMPKPKVLDMNQINSPNYFAGLINDLVEIKGIGFSPIDTNKIYVEINQTAQSRVLNSCGGDAITLRTNSYASFSGQKTPKGYGNIIGIATNYGTTKQLVIRNTTEWSMNYTTCITPGQYLKKNFNDNSVTSGGWTTKNVTANINWTTGTAGSWINKPYAVITNFPSNVACESWLISPSLDLSGSINPILVFQNAYNYTGPTLQLMVSTNYVSGLPSTATWTPLTFNASPGGFAFVNSGNISLNSYKVNGVRIAFKYATTGSGATWEVDDVAVIEN